MNWNKKHKEGWHIKGSKCSNGGTYANYEVQDKSGNMVARYKFEKAAIDQCNYLNSMKLTQAEIDRYIPYKVIKLT